MSDIEHIIEKENAAMLEYVCNLTKLLTEVEKLGFVTLRNKITDYFTKKRIGLKGSLNDYDLFTAEGLDSQRLNALIKKYDIEGDIITDKASNVTMFAVNKKSLSKLLKLEKDIREGRINIEDVYQDYLKEQEAVEKQGEAFEEPADFEGLGDVLEEMKEQEKEPEEQTENPDMEEDEEVLEELEEQENDLEDIFLFGEEEGHPKKEQKNAADKPVAEEIQNSEDELEHPEPEGETKTYESEAESELEVDKESVLIDEEPEKLADLQVDIGDAADGEHAEYPAFKESQQVELDEESRISDFVEKQPKINMGDSSVSVNEEYLEENYILAEEPEKDESLHKAHDLQKTQDFVGQSEENLGDYLHQDILNTESLQEDTRNDGQPPKSPKEMNVRESSEEQSDFFTESGSSLSNMPQEEFIQSSPEGKVDFYPTERTVFSDKQSAQTDNQDMKSSFSFVDDEHEHHNAELFRKPDFTDNEIPEHKIIHAGENKAVWADKAPQDNASDDRVPFSVREMLDSPTNKTLQDDSHGIREPLPTSVYGTDSSIRQDFADKEFSEHKSVHTVKWDNDPTQDSTRSGQSMFPFEETPSQAQHGFGNFAGETSFPKESVSPRENQARSETNPHQLSFKSKEQEAEKVKAASNQAVLPKKEFQNGKSGIDDNSVKTGNYSAEKKSMPFLSYSEALAEKDRNEKREAIQKQLNRKAEQDKIEVSKIATGAALLAGYQSSQAIAGDSHIPNARLKSDSGNLKYVVSNYPKVSADHLTSGQSGDYEKIPTVTQTAPYPTAQADTQVPTGTSGSAVPHAKHLTGRKQDDALALAQEKHGRDFENRDTQAFAINHMQLQNRYMSSVNQNTFLQMGEMLLSGANEGYRVSDQGRGKSSYAGISAYSANRGYKALAKDVERLAYRKIDKTLKTPGNSYSVLNSFLAANGLREMNFSTMKDSRNTMESLYISLQKAGLASKRGEVWDVMKFETMYKRAAKRNDFSELARAFGMSGNHPYDWKAIVEAYADIMKRTKKQRTSMAEKIRSGKSMRSMIYHKLGQNSDVLSGYMQSKQAAKTVRSTYRAAKLFAVLNGKLAWKVAIFVADRKIMENSLYTQGMRAIEQKKQAHEEKIKEKAVKKQVQKEERIKANKKKKESRREVLKKRYDKVAPKLLRTNGAIGKRVGKINQKVKSVSSKITKSLSRLNPFKIIAVKNLLMMKLKKWALIIAGAIMLFSMAIIVLVISMTSVLGFFTGDESSPENSYASIMGKSLQKLQKAEAQWASGLKNTTPTISLSNYSVRYGESYVKPEAYVPTEPNARAEWNGHNVQWVNTGYSGYFTANPFGNYEVAGNVPLKKLTSFDGGVELKYRSKDGSSRTSNIKEILTMADIYFMFSMEAEDAHEMDSDASISAGTKQSGLTYASSNETVTAADKKLASGVIWDYCQNLFNVSHQEVIDISYVVLPTCMTDVSGGGNTDTDNEVNTDAVTFCPQGDIGGCSTFDNFVYRQGIKGLYDTDGGFHVVGAVMPLQDDGQSYAEGEESKEMCYADTVDGFYESLKNGHAACWEVQSTTTNSTICDYNPNTDDNGDMDIPDELRAIIGDHKSVIEVSYNNGVVTVKTERGVQFTDHEVMVWVDEITKWPNGDITYGYYEPHTHKDLQMENTTYTFKHKCTGGHKGRFCGGHLKADLTGVIYGFTDEQIAAEGGGNLVGKVDDNAFVHKDVSSFTVNDEAAMYASEDLFEMDSHVTHSSEREDWEGWTSDNMELAMLKYNMDWEELYGITFASAVGGEALGEQQKEQILEAIQSNYPDLSEERMNVIKEALSWVGNIGYDQRHHSCPLTGPCIYNPNITCMMSDCSGFTSFLWKDRLGGIYTTASFYRHPMMTGKYNSGTVKPGDILVHYGGAVADGRDDHALLYLGSFEFDGMTQEWTVDCSTQNGVGNVFFRHRNYYPECYVVSPAP